MQQYQEDYYKSNQQSEDRIGLVFFSNILKSFFRGGKMLDYGCGTGFFLKRFADNLYVKSLFDISDYACKRASEVNPQADVVKDITTDIANESLDCIASLHTLEHIEQPQEILAVFHQKLKAGGILFFVVPNDDSWGKKLKKEHWFAYRDATHISLLPVKDWCSLVKATGFSVLRTGTDGLWDVPYISYLPVFLQKLLFFPTAAIQLILNKLILPLPLGENLIIIARK